MSSPHTVVKNWDVQGRQRVATAGGNNATSKIKWTLYTIISISDLILKDLKIQRTHYEVLHAVVDITDEHYWQIFVSVM